MAGNSKDYARTTYFVRLWFLMSFMAKIQYITVNQLSLKSNINQPTLMSGNGERCIYAYLAVLTLLLLFEYFPTLCKPKLVPAVVCKVVMFTPPLIQTHCRKGVFPHFCQSIFHNQVSVSIILEVTQFTVCRLLRHGRNSADPKNWYPDE